MWIFEVRHEDKGPAFTVVLSSGIVFSTILIQSVPLVYLKKTIPNTILELKMWFYYMKIFLTIIQDKMLYLIINLDYGTWLNC